jgi:hypothetical protein
MNLLTILVALITLLSANLVVLPVKSVNATDSAHKGEIDIETKSGTDLERYSESADKSSKARVQVENSLDLDVDKDDPREIKPGHDVLIILDQNRD